MTDRHTLSLILLFACASSPLLSAEPVPPAFIATAQDDKGGHLVFQSNSTDGEGFQWHARFTAWLAKAVP